VNELRIPLCDLEEARRLVTLFGVANDAYDHGSRDEAQRLHDEATRGLRAIVAKRPSLLDWLPRLPEMLDEGLLVYAWPTVLRGIENAIAERSSGH
jgi:hypothetical protein